jgi:valyl-tRNA synthetase
MGIKLVSPPLSSSRGIFNIGQALTSVCADAFYRYYLIKSKKINFASRAYNAQGRPLDAQVDFNGDLKDYQERCKELAYKQIKIMETSKARINLLPSLNEYLDFSEESRTTSQLKFLELFTKGFLIRNQRKFYLDVQKVVESRDINKILEQIRIKPESFRKTLEQLLRDARNPLSITKSRLFATPIPIYFCSNCPELYSPQDNTIPFDPRTTLAECPKCSKQNKNEMTDTLDPLFDLSVQGYSLHPVDSPADIQICGRNMATRYIYYSFLTHAAMDNLPAFKNLFIHNILNDNTGIRLSNKNGNLTEIKNIASELHGDTIRYALFKAVTLRDETANLSQTFFEEGQKAVYRIGNLRKFFKTHKVSFAETQLDENNTQRFSELMENLELGRGFDIGQEYITNLSRSIKEEHDSRRLGNFSEKAIKYKSSLFMIEPFMPEITKKSKQELGITY